MKLDSPNSVSLREYSSVESTAKPRASRAKCAGPRRLARGTRAGCRRVALADAHDLLHDVCVSRRGRAQRDRTRRRVEPELARLFGSKGTRRPRPRAADDALIARFELDLSFADSRAARSRCLCAPSENLLLPPEMSSSSTSSACSEKARSSTKSLGVQSAASLRARAARRRSARPARAERRPAAGVARASCRRRRSARWLCRPWARFRNGRGPAPSAASASDSERKLAVSRLSWKNKALQRFAIGQDFDCCSAVDQEIRAGAALQRDVQISGS